MNNLRKNVELAANIAIVVVAILLCVTLVKNQFAGNSNLRADNARQIANKEVKPIEKVNLPDVLPDVDWQKNRQTLLLALSTTCHFCTESAGFYQKLKRESDKTHLLAVFPQSASEGEDYLKKLAVSVDEVRQVPFENLNVSGTPTLLLVGSNGEAVDSWVGKLTSNQEAQVLARLKQN
jgi:thioredoxin-related protein